MLDFGPQLFNLCMKLIFPPSCIICGKLNSNYICDLCNRRISKYEIFKIYNKNILNTINGEIYFDKIMYCYRYYGLIRKIILQYKFNNKSFISNFFANKILSCEKLYKLFTIYDIIIPVPMEKTKKQIRGYNQTELISNIITQNTSLKDGKEILVKTKRNKTQSLLNYYERKENVKNVFYLKDQKAIIKKNVILLDDIYTTGATVNEISKILKQHGANQILVIILAKD